MRTRRKERQPHGRLQASFEQLFYAGCIQAGGDNQIAGLEYAERRFSKIYLLLVNATQGNPCDGCPAWKTGTCSAYLRFHTEAQERTLRAARQIPKPTKSVQRCPECGLKVRGDMEKHREGEQHLKRAKAR